MAKHHQYTVMDPRQLTVGRAMRRKLNRPRRGRGYEELIAAQRTHRERLQQAHDAARLRTLNKAVARQAAAQLRTEMLPRRSQP